MLELKKDQNSRIVMYSFEGMDSMNKVDELFKDSKGATVIFEGRRSELLEKDEEFWEEIIDPLLFAYDSYPTAKESGHSALSLIKGEYILIVKKTMNKDQLHTSIYNLDPHMDDPHIWIQWKGTNVCADIHCSCGHFGHADEDFFYHYECPACKKKFSVGQNVKLYELNDEQIKYVEQTSVGFKTSRIDD